MGSVPRTVEKAVIRIGRKRAADASSAACWRPRPSSRFCLANSTIRMPFLVTSPISITSPIWLNTLSVLPNTHSAPSAPSSASGTVSRIVIGSRKLSNWAASTR